MPLGELVAAGIMESDGAGDYRFADEDGAREAGDQRCSRGVKIGIERERFEPPDASGLSDTARELVRRIVEGESVKVDESTPGNLS